ncbi:hypothetical protein COY62_00080 [bacterium (Candidatus Howlettbacteria) CG_4_10_14_0_8_um_filter_40_9]|nr:MAG: hypothetical protein COY62_00080 [bacterium (Candidatus Howlettbacteria) CG_4_10_14_0_8_um_filter_40_9]
MKVTRHTLKNGIRTVIAEMPDREVVATSVYVGAGGRYETPKTYGISHFLEHMLGKGTEKYPSQEIFNSLIASVGGIRNATTGSEWTRYYNLMPKTHRLIGFEALSEQISRPLLEKEEIEKERGTITEEINMTYDNPGRAIWFRFRSFAWEGQPVESDLLGPKENILRLERKDLDTYMKSHYIAENITICVAGDLKPKETIKELEQYFGGVKKGKKLLSRKIDNKQVQSRVLVSDKKIDQAHIVLGYKSFSYSDKRRFALDVLMAILGGGNSSTLYKEIRGKRGLAYNIWGKNGYFVDAGISEVYAGLSKDKVYDALKIIKSELYNSKEVFSPKGEIKKAKELLKGRKVMRLDDTLGSCLEYGSMELLDPLKLDPKEEAKMIDKVTAEEIREVAREIFQDSKENLVVIGPYRDKKKFEKALIDY